VIDEPLLTQLGLHPQLASWKQTCQEVVSRSENHA
jgi:hypothetical protein